MQYGIILGRILKQKKDISGEKMVKFCKAYSLISNIVWLLISCSW